MHDITDRNSCTGCGCCSVVCPTGCISMAKDAEGFFYPAIDEELCVSCGMCVRSCPANASEDDLGREDSTYYMARHKNHDLLRRCSSGGVFDALAGIVLSDGGVVFGAARDSVSGDVRHEQAEAFEGLSPLRLSKYSQSSAWESYEAAKACLQQRRHVLFTGTPCQLAGLRSYLGKLGDSPDLITLEVLCHGVTSASVVNAYLRSEEKRLGRTITGVRFRDKGGRWGWEDSSHAILLVSGPTGDKEVRDKSDAFMYGYIRSLYFRESCYRCRYCNVRRQSDFMAGDFWGVSERRMPSRERRLGVSIVAVTGERANLIMPMLGDALDLVPIDVSEAIPENGALVRPAKRPNCRDTVFASLDKSDFNAYMWRHYGKGVLKRRIRCLIGPKMSKIISTVKRIALLNISIWAKD